MIHSSQPSQTSHQLLRPAAKQVLQALGAGSATSRIRGVSPPPSSGIIELAQSIAAHLKVTQLTPLFFGKQAGLSIKPPFPMSNVYDTRVGALMEIASSDRTLLAEAVAMILLKQPCSLSQPTTPTQKDLEKRMEQLGALV